MDERKGRQDVLAALRQATERILRPAVVGPLTPADRELLSRLEILWPDPKTTEGT
jgi:hypothetical protein